MWHYTKPFWPWVLATSVLAAVVAVIEVSLFAFLGSVVDWLAKTTPDTVFQDYWWQLSALAVLILVLHPLLNFVYELIIHQTLMGNYPMLIRWQAHRYVLRQSLEFFQNDFAGRVATKVMQSSLAVREVVMKTADVFVFVVVYFTAAITLFAASDWRLAMPMVIWLIGYSAALYYFVPKLKRVSKDQANARSVVTGRIVDSYTNIPTVKMFAHTEFEDEYARHGMEPFLEQCAPADAPVDAVDQHAQRAQLPQPVWCRHRLAVAVVHRRHHRRRHCICHWPGVAPERHGALDHVGSVRTV